MILLQQWVAGRVRTPGRFWRAVRRIDARSIDLVTATTRALMLVACVLVLFGMTGCAGSGTIMRIGMHADVTDIVRGCDRKHDASCGLDGPREIAVLEFIYAPGLRVDRTVAPYCSALHGSHYTAGKPFNNRFEQVIDTAGCGAFVQFGVRQ
ncbi:MAG TPA: hypothetical protein VD932_03890 [Aquabacterium sp.]|nr:hypothetical protein [Aquabacterium sp.]